MYLLYWLLYVVIFVFAILTIGTCWLADRLNVEPDLLFMVVCKAVYNVFKIAWGAR